MLDLLHGRHFSGCLYAEYGNCRVFVLPCFLAATRPDLFHRAVSDAQKRQAPVLCTQSFDWKTRGGNTWTCDRVCVWVCCGGNSGSVADAKSDFVNILNETSCFGTCHDPHMEICFCYLRK